MGIGAALVGIVLLFPLTQKPIAILIEDDLPLEKRTIALTVSHFLAGSEIQLNQGDKVQPPLNHWLRPGETIRILRAAWIHINADGKSFQMRSTARLPANLLAEAGIRLFPGDQLLFNGEPIAPDQMLPSFRTYSLQVIRARPLTINLDGEQDIIFTTEPTIGNALEKAGFQVRASDRVSPSLEALIEGPTKVDFKRARRIAITSMGNTIHTLSAAETIGEALAEAGIALQGLDYSRPSPETRLSEIPSQGEQEVSIEVFRVQENQILEKELLPYETEIQLVEDLEIDKTEIIQPGAFGITLRRIRVRLVNGKEISREVEEEHTALEPQNEIKGFGKKLIQHTLDTPDGTLTYWRALNMYAVSYKPSSSGNFTSIGLPLRKGIVAVDTDYIAYGTRMYIPGYGFAIAGDTGGGVVGRLIDLGYSDEDYVSWHQWVTVYFLWPPPEVIAWIYP